MTEPLSHARIRALLMLGAVLALILSTTWIRGTGDFIEFYVAARRFSLGLNPYEASFFPKGYTFGFPYPPIAIDLVLPWTLLVFQNAATGWVLLNLLAYLIVIYSWTSMLWGQKQRLEHFAPILAACTTLPSLIAFHACNFNILILCFGTIAYQLTKTQKLPWVSGLLTGLLLVKPHLTLLPALELFRASRKKTVFLLGLGSLWLASLLPFANTYRPWSDLALMQRASVDYRTRVFYQDEQSVAACLYRGLWVRWHHPDLLKESPEPGQVVPAVQTQTYNRIKALSFLGFLSAWVYFRRQNRWHQDSTLFAAAFAVNLLGAIYSHVYDSLLLVPILLCGIHFLSRRFPLSDIACAAIVLNLAVCCVGAQTWNRLGYLSVLFALPILLLYRFSNVSKFST